VLEVEGDGSLALVHAHEATALGGRDGAGVAPEVAVGRLDLGHVRAEGGEHLAGEGAGDVLAEVEDADAGEDALHGLHPRGRPRPRVAMIFRLISEVPAAMVNETLERTVCGTWPCMGAHWPSSTWPRRPRV